MGDGKSDLYEQEDERRGPLELITSASTHYLHHYNRAMEMGERLGFEKEYLVKMWDDYEEAFKKSNGSTLVPGMATDLGRAFSHTRRVTKKQYYVFDNFVHQLSSDYLWNRRGR